MNVLLPEETRDASIAHMQTGIALLDRAEWQEALKHFNAAIRLREQLPWRDEPLSAWLLAAAWINRSDALRRLPGTPHRGEAIVSLDHAIAAMGYIPLHENPAYPERLILAWINRATTCGEIEDDAAASHAFSQAESLLKTWGRATSPRRRLLTGMLHVNRALILLDQHQPLAAWEDACAATGVLKGVNAASAAIKAWSIQCRALALLLDEPQAMDRLEDWIALATDAAEEALTLVKLHDYSDPWVTDLVRYGAKIYRVCQPQFLAEFLCDWLTGGPLAGEVALRQEMKVELLLARADLEKRVLASPHETEYIQSQMRLLKSLQFAELQLGN